MKPLNTVLFLTLGLFLLTIGLANACETHVIMEPGMPARTVTICSPPSAPAPRGVLDDFNAGARQFQNGMNALGRAQR